VIGILLDQGLPRSTAEVLRSDPNLHADFMSPIPKIDAHRITVFECSVPRVPLVPCLINSVPINGKIKL
jgi:hypothetical protein